ncbi:unnamed protein product [[Candida] boidinii]|uniref:Unnamed protein product n=1 Tax=Candida boidinii TaxID=5477 RepID=A0A9W6SZ20_CANBO|nr:hypothetical protein B5S30_g2785 [[Candida] boidinii]GME70509.1 unnamed protein product [[Candida] boidinii]
MNSSSRSRSRIYSLSSSNSTGSQGSRSSSESSDTYSDPNANVGVIQSTSLYSDGLATDEKLINMAIEKGLNEFQSKNYSKSLKIFTRGISVIEEAYKLAKSKANNAATTKNQECSRGHVRHHQKYGSLLDYRAACFEKLNKLKYAIQDSDKLIKYEPYSCKGYLRKAKILKLSKKYDDSLFILNFAVKKLEEGSQKHGNKLRISQNLFNKLKSERDQMFIMVKENNIESLNSYDLDSDEEEGEGSSKNTHSQSSKYHLKRLSSSISFGDDNRNKKRSTKYIDFISNLPYELNYEILKYLDQTSILNCLMVNKIWNKKLSKMNELFCHPKLKLNLSINLMNKFLSFINNHNIKRIKRLILNPNISCELSILKLLLSSSSSGSSSWASSIMVESLTLYLNNLNLFQIFKVIPASSYNKNYLLNHLIELNIHVTLVEDFNYLLRILSFTKNLKSLNLSIIDMVNLNLKNNNLNLTAISNLSFALDRLSILISPKINKDKLKQHLTRNFFTNFFKSLTAQNYKKLNYLNLNNLLIDIDKLEKIFKTLENLNFLVLNLIPNVTLNLILESLSYNSNNNLIQFEFNELSVNSNSANNINFNLNTLNNLNNNDLIKFDNLFKNLRILNFTNSNLLKKNLTKILESTNKNLVELTLQNNLNLNFSLSSFSLLGASTSRIVDFSQILPLLPNLVSLNLSSSVNFNDNSLKNFASSNKTYKLLRNLKLLNLSSNNITGIGLINLFKLNSSFFNINHLIVKNCDIHPDTINLLLKSGFCEKITVV